MNDHFEILMDIHNRRGRLDPEIVIEEATPEESPLHGSFEWDDSRAGDLYRLVQARILIKKVKILIPETEIPVSAFIHLRGESEDINGKGVYIPFHMLISHPDLFMQAVEEFSIYVNTLVKTLQIMLVVAAKARKVLVKEKEIA